MESWQSHHIEEVVGNWGAPSSTLQLKGGKKVYSWVSNWGSAYLMSTCRQSFTTSSKGIVYKWRYTGCPYWQSISMDKINTMPSDLADN
ncbi:MULTISPECIES: hypothetical protein [unclassified Endozoicomonas]|uniref:hypothetical protein n=1 Tax=unclassified Endozoicomonas TaxID=2644528 RepID=UPI0021497DE1|nr:MULTISPECIES: hypothetical protein [unclassified Endozoicomonas]